MMWGKAKENGIWRVPISHWRFMVLGGDRIVFVAFGHWRFRLMKWWLAEIAEEESE